MDKYPVRDGNIWMCPMCFSNIYMGEEDCELCGQGINWKFEGVNPPENIEGEQP